MDEAWSRSLLQTEDAGRPLWNRLSQHCPPRPASMGCMPCPWGWEQDPGPPLLSFSAPCPLSEDGGLLFEWVKVIQTNPLASDRARGYFLPFRDGHQTRTRTGLKYFVQGILKLATKVDSEIYSEAEPGTRTDFLCRELTLFETAEQGYRPIASSHSVANNESLPLFLHKGSGLECPLFRSPHCGSLTPSA